MATKNISEKRKKWKKKIKPRIPVAPPGRRHASKKDYKRKAKHPKKIEDEQ